MKKLFSFAMLVAVLSQPVPTFPLSGEHIPGFPVRQRQFWPKGLADVLNRGGRVYGLFCNFFDYFFFTGDAEDFNEFLRECAVLEGVSPKLIVQAGEGKVQTGAGDTISFDWKVTTPQLIVEFPITGRVALEEITGPGNVKIEAGAENDKIARFIAANRAKRQEKMKTETEESSPGV